jgi:LAGLIDADG endonuclease
MKSINLQEKLNFDCNDCNDCYDLINNEVRSPLVLGTKNNSNFNIKESKMEVLSKNNIKNPNYLYFLGGFVEGEGSNSVSISVNKNFKYGINLQPVFNVTQHENGLKILYSFKELFRCGSIVEKSGSPHIWVYTLKGYKQIIEHVIPFLETYVQPFSCKKEEFNIFFTLVLNSASGHQKNKNTLIEMVKLVYKLEGKGKNRKRRLDEILEIINDKTTYFNNIKINTVLNSEI